MARRIRVFKPNRGFERYDVPGDAAHKRLRLNVAVTCGHHGRLNPELCCLRRGVQRPAPGLPAGCLYILNDMPYDEELRGHTTYA